MLEAKLQKKVNKLAKKWGAEVAETWEHAAMHGLVGDSLDSYVLKCNLIITHDAVPVKVVFLNGHRLFFLNLGIFNE